MWWTCALRVERWDGNLQVWTRTCLPIFWIFSADAVLFFSWYPTGVHQGIGVFIWSTGSHEDQVIEADEPRLAFLSPRPLANGTVASI